MRIRSVQDDESLTAREKSMAIISIMRNISPADLRKIPVGQFDAIATEAAEALDIAPAEIKDEYTIGGVKCRLFRTVNAMTAIQFSDLVNTIKRGDTEANMPTILSILLVPEGARYPDYDRHGLEEKIVEDFDVADAISIANFIHGLSRVSHANIVTSLIMNETTIWTGVPKWRRKLTRRLINALLTPSPRLLAKNGDLLFGLTKSQSNKAAPGRKLKDSTSSSS